MLRSILAIVAGYAALVAATMIAISLLMLAIGIPFDPKAAETPPPAYVIANLIVGVPCAAIGGFVAAWLAGRSPRGHALVLAGIVLAMGIAFALTSTSPAHTWWYRMLLPISGAAGVAIGGWLYRGERVAKAL